MSSSAPEGFCTHPTLYQCAECNAPGCMTCDARVEGRDDFKTAVRWCVDCVEAEARANGLSVERMREIRERRVLRVDDVTAERIAQRLADPRPPNAALRALFQGEQAPEVVVVELDAQPEQCGQCGAVILGYHACEVES